MTDRHPFNGFFFQDNMSKLTAELLTYLVIQTFIKDAAFEITTEYEAAPVCVV